MLQEKIAIRHNVVILSGWNDANVDASQDGVQLTLAGSGNDGKLMLRPGWVIGIAGTLSAAATAGSLTVGVTIDGTENATTTQTITDAAEFKARFTTSQGIRFTEGQQIGVEITTDGTWNGTSSDLDVDVYVVYDDWEF